MNETLKALLTSVAPTLTTMLGGPLAGTAVTALEGAFGLSAGAGPEAITKVIQSGGMTPEIIAAVRAADQKHEELMGQQKIDLEKLNADHEAVMEAASAGDRDSARKREETVKDKMPALLACGVTLGFFGILGFMLKHELPDGSKDIVNVMLGSLGTAWIAIVQYYFGSSRSSDRKTELLAQQQ